ncbi:MAG TPA: VOC family protein [Actinophytocola sp.]|uniref:VOC family protein n=1 Tax=Actinophytocola sp. TaxID=1872138 RepID=UPI002DFB7AC2|nr:VOC family protein [Actinophytocola sp.]
MRLQANWHGGTSGTDLAEHDHQSVPRKVIPRAQTNCRSGKITLMERVVGIGGYFLRAADPAALSTWYRESLGLDADENGVWHQQAGSTVFAPFEADTDYFGSRSQHTMLNFRVRDLDAMLAQLRNLGADVAAETQDLEGVGRFGWVTDPEGNRIELWQPAD